MASFIIRGGTLAMPVAGAIGCRAAVYSGMAVGSSASIFCTRIDGGGCRGTREGIRRESVTAAASKLQNDGLISYSRGTIKVLDRPKLEMQVCECYEVVKSEYDRLLPRPCAD